MTDIGSRIKNRRKELGFSAEKVAEMVGISPATMYRYEKNEIANMGTDKLLPIAEALSTSPAYLMGWSDDPTPVSEDTGVNSVEKTSEEGKPVRKSLNHEDFDTILREPESELRRRIREHRELREKAKAVSSPRFTHSIETTRLAQSLIEQLGLKDATESSGVSFSQSYGSSISSDSTRSSGLSRAAQLVGEQYDSLDDYGKKAVEAILAIEMSRVQGMRVMAEDGKLVFEFSDPTGMFSGRR